ncbi:MAG: magnesium-translocating P-type ATPase [Armatimonadota bacterium]|nr:magnesium-translocating P-type ATPase [Armatimonadota bacterium]
MAALLDTLGTGPDGLPADVAAARLGTYGPNELHPPRRRALIVEYLSRFSNPLVLILLAASVVSVFTGDAPSAGIIAVIIAMSVTLDFVQERRAGRAAERLRESVAVHTSVLRSGAVAEVPADRVVPGDVVVLAAGDLVPADGRVLEARDFFVRQAALTGEPYPVEKSPGDLPPGTGLDEATNAAFMGTSVVSGTARVLICRTGRATAFGGIAAALADRTPPTAFERGTRQFGLLIMRLTFLLVLFVLLVNAVFRRPALESFLFAIALAVGLTPELLPMIVSVTLARGAIRMAERKVIVKRLASIQDLGSMDVLCTDKTGTLTEARIALERHVDAYGRDSRRVLELAYLNSAFETGIRSPLDDAILARTDVDVQGWRRIDEVPFDFERRRVSVLIERDAERILVVKGAPEDIWRLCAQVETGDPPELRPLDAGIRAQIEALFTQLSRDGLRVLAVAWKAVPPDHGHARVDDESALVFAGFVAFADPPKAGAAEAFARLARAGVAVKIVTGDNELVTQHVCARLGIPVTGVLLGTAIAEMDEAALAAQAEDASLFCRVTPAQKNRIILALRARGHVVGYLGDGINDAPPLHSADVGISVSSAVDVAREAASLIMLESDLRVLHDGVMEGRRTFANVMKYIMMGTSSNFGNMFSMAGATLVLPFLPMLPVQILLNNLLYDISELPIPADSVDPEDVARPRRWDMGFVRSFMLTIGPISSVFDFATFYVLLRVFAAHEGLFHTGWFVESLVTQTLVIFVIRTRGHPLRSRPAPWLALTSVAVIALAVALPYLPVAGRLGFVPLPPTFLLILAALAALYLAAVETVKRRFYRHIEQRTTVAPGAAA